MKTFLFVFLLVIISSCHTETGDYIPVRSLDLSSCEKIVYQEIVVKDYLLSYPTGIFLIDGKLVIKDEKGYRKLFHVITKMENWFRNFSSRVKVRKSMFLQILTLS